MRGPDGRPASYSYTGPQSALWKNGEVWTHVERSPAAVVWDGDHREYWGAYDLRRLGLNPNSFDVDLDEMARNAGDGPLHYAESHEDGLFVVRASSTNGEFCWWIDPAQDYSIVRTAVYLGGRKIGETIYQNELIDETWFPRRIEHYRLGAGDTTPSRVIEVIHAEFNRPEHPQTLGPADIGIEVGTSIQFSDYRTLQRIGGFWDGQRVVSGDVFWPLVASGELTRSPALRRELARLGAYERRQLALGAVTKDDPIPNEFMPLLQNRSLSEWERYTAEFIEKHKLDDDQRQKAWSILKDCQERAEKHLSSSREELTAVERKMKTLDGGSLPQQKEAAAQMMRKLREPIDRIFEEQLKPRLDGLLTRQQRKAADLSSPGGG